MAWTGLLDFRKIPGNMISGLSEEEIQSLTENLHESDFNFELVPTTSNAIRQGKRFGKSLSSEEVKQSISNTTQLNTKRRNKWAINIFDVWIRQHELVDNEYVRLYPFENKDITQFSIEQINHWLSRFFFEVRKLDGSLYPQRSLV